MDPRFNLREICKQCILLEDHLTHERKRCIDCCTKHFLTLEALAEEALTLDKESQYKDELTDLPNMIRHLQKLWVQQPENCHEISQQLRQLRKKYQEKNFDIIFTSDCNECQISPSGGNNPA
jgi:hypothetical protein